MYKIIETDKLKNIINGIWDGKLDYEDVCDTLQQVLNEELYRDTFSYPEIKVLTTVYNELEENIEEYNREYYEELKNAGCDEYQINRCDFYGLDCNELCPNYRKSA